MHWFDHSVCCFVFKQDLIVFRNSRDENDRFYIVKTMNPFTPFGALTSNVKYTKRLLLLFNAKMNAYRKSKSLIRNLTSTTPVVATLEYKMSCSVGLYPGSCRRETESRKLKSKKLSTKYLSEVTHYLAESFNWYSERISYAFLTPLSFHKLCSDLATSSVKGCCSSPASTTRYTICLSLYKLRKRLLC